MALKIDKDTALEFTEQYKDQLLVGTLVVVLLVGGWFLWSATGTTTQEFVDTARESRGAGGGGGDDVVDPNELLTLLTEKRDRTMYNLERNPFGSPSEQMRRREEVQQAYQRGVELFNTDQFDQAIAQFDRVIELDVTESRIQYPVRPTEYKIRATQQKALTNFEGMMQQATQKVSQADSLIASNQRTEALALYAEVAGTMGDLQQSDPDGSVLGQEKYDQVVSMYTEANSKAMSIRGQVLQENITNDTREARRVLPTQDFVGMLKSQARLLFLINEIESVDPNANLITRQTRSQISSLFQQLNEKLNANLVPLQAQAEAQFEAGWADGDLQATQDAIAALIQIQSFQPSQELARQISVMRERRAALVIQKAQEFVQAQSQVLTSGDFDAFDQQGKIRFLTDLNVLSEIFKTGNATLRDQITTAITQVNGLQLPPLVTDDYEILTIARSDTLFTAKINDKSTSRTRERTIVLREGRADNTTGIVLKQVDIEGGFVILSKPGYRDARVDF